MWKTILGGHVWHGEMHNRRKDGTPLEEDATITPVKNAAGEITHFIAIKQDITDKKTLEKQFLRAQRMESIGLLAGGIAHDLNNVLAPILMGAEVLKMFTKDAEMNRQLDSIMQSAERGAGIVKQVLTFARGIEGERVALHPKHIIKEMVRMARETFPRNLQFRVDVPNELWPVLGDPTQLHQVLLNLSVNARDAMPDGGELIYSARNAEVDLALAKANPGAKPGPHVVLCVRDTGGGIPPAVMERIWEPFFTTKEVGKGTGLGLPTVLGIVRSHGGFILVESEVGRGTTFEIYLPAAPQAAGAVAAANPDPLPVGKGELVLVVDDEPDLINVTRAMLERHGYRVLAANDGTAALAQVSEHKGEIQLVITDILMPFMDGVQFIRALRRLTPGMPIIASSGALGMPGQQDRTDEVHALGVKQILHKPYSVEVLLRTVHSELHKGEAGLPG
jgi:signal transduction histidine kinase/ActR/RegA family two-component response regulator